MKKFFHKSMCSLLDNNSKYILRELPNKFTTRLFLEKVRLILPAEYGKSICDFGGENMLVSWVNQYYLDRRPCIVKKKEPSKINGVIIDLTPKSILDRRWIKVKK